MVGRRLTLAAWALTLAAAATVDRYVHQTDDAVIIEAGVDESSDRESRSQQPSQRAQTVVPPGWPGLPAGVSENCETPDGRSGTCVTRAVCIWSRAGPINDDGKFTPCLMWHGRAGSGAAWPLTRGVCCPGLFSGSATTTTSTTTASPSTAAAVTYWWQTTSPPTKATTTAPPRVEAPTLAAAITHGWMTTTSPPKSTTGWWQATAAPTAAVVAEVAGDTTATTSTTTATTTTSRTTPASSAATTTAWWQTTTSGAAPAGTTAKTTVAPPTASGESGKNFSACGTRSFDSNRIVNGVEAIAGEYPWMAGIFKGKRQFCGGSLIDNTHILTAAHCVAHMTSYDVRRLIVRLGDHDIKNTSEAKHEEFKVIRVIRHKGFSEKSLHTDIALLTLTKPVVYKDNIRPVCMADGTARYTGEPVIVAGWGSLSEAGRQPSKLQKVTLKVWKNEDCAASYGASAPGGIIGSMMCAGQKEKDSCSGDSGGPLMHVGSVVTQVGVVSWGIGCAKPEYPGVYTRVNSLLSWINRNRKAY